MATAVIECAPGGCPRDDRAPQRGGVLRVHADAEPAGLCDLVDHEAWVRNIVENQVRALATTGKTRSGVLPNATPY